MGLSQQLPAGSPDTTPGAEAFSHLRLQMNLNKAEAGNQSRVNEAIADAGLQGKCVRVVAVKNPPCNRCVGFCGGFCVLRPLQPDHDGLAGL